VARGATMPAPRSPGDERERRNLEGPLVRKTSFQRSKEIIRFPIIEEVHLSALIEDEPRPDVKEAFKASCDEFAVAGEKVALPEPATELLQCDVLQVFKQRRSSFGRFSNHTPLTLKQFATMLYFAAASRNYMSDLKLEDGSPHFTRLLTFVNNVEGIRRGAYAYDWNRHCLWTIAQQDYSLFLQEQYFLQNYNLSEVAALLVIAGRPERMMDIYGNRGYRLINAEIGLVAQSIYMAATALAFNCGAALGFNNIALNTELGFDGSDQRSFLFLLVGNGPGYNADFDVRLA
jgi:SagB-type dehydrogenase family enzyme